MREHHYIIAFARVMHQGALNFIRNAWLSTAATAIMVVTLTILLSTLVLNKALDDTINEVAADVTISIYIKDDTDQEKIDDLGSRLKQEPEVKSVTFIDKDQALGRYLERNRDNPELIEAVSIVGNAFPASYEIELKDLSRSQSLVTIAKSGTFSPIIDKFDESRLSTVQKIGDAKKFITRSGVLAALLFAIISILVIFNTIRMTIFTRADEITIMRLIGATNGYIRGPFLFEAVLYGVVAAIISLIFVYTTLNTLGPKVNRHVLFDPTIQLLADYWPLITLSTMGTGIVIGVVSSSLATKRYMKH